MAKVSSGLEIQCSPNFGPWLQQQQISFAFTTYQTNRLFVVGTTAGKIAAQERLFDKPMGLFAQGEHLYMSGRYQLWRLDNILAEGEQYGTSDRLHSLHTV